MNPLPPDHNLKAQIDAEALKLYFLEANDLPIAGMLVQCVCAYFVHELVPLWTWAPALIFLGLVTLFRVVLTGFYHRFSEHFSYEFWSRAQTVGGVLAGLCWGVSAVLMFPHLPGEYQLLIVAVLGVSAASAASEAFTFRLPACSFVFLSILPSAIWMLMDGGDLHTSLGFLLLLLMLVTMIQMQKRNLSFRQALQVRIEKEELLAELQAQRDAVTQANIAKSRFLAAASHDLRQPLQALAIFIDLLRDEVKGTPSAPFLVDRASQAAGALNSLLDSLLDISRLDANVVEAHRETLSVAQLLEQLQREFDPQAKRKGLDLRIHYTELLVDTDSVLLLRILRNLISNALRYTQRGRVVVGCRRRAGKLWIEVHDTGIGIPYELQQAVFREFFQVDNRERDRKEGLGLGLAIVKRIANLLGHPLILRSKPRQGSYFALGLPIVALAELEENDADADESNFTLAGRLILLIENEESIRTGLEMTLRQRGCEVISAESVTQLLENLAGVRRRPDAVISDLGLKNAENGLDGIAHLRQRYGQSFPALLVSGDTSSEALQAAKAANLALLHKPIEPQRLFVALMAALVAPLEATAAGSATGS